MKFTCLLKDVTKFADTISNISSANTTIPVTSSVLLEVRDSFMEITSTNLEFGIAHLVPVKKISDSENTKATVPAKTFVKTITSLSKNSNQIQIELKDDLLHLNTDSESISIITKDPEDFPSLPKPQTQQAITLNPKLLLDGMKSVKFAASVTTVKPELSSVYMYSDGGDMVFVSTDQFRLAEKKIKSKDKIPHPLIVPIQNVDFIISVLSKTNSEILLYPEQDKLTIKTDSALIYSRVIDESFPNYQAIIPESFNIKLTMLKSELQDMLSKMSIFSDKFGKIVFQINPSQNQVVVYAKNSDTGEIQYKPHAKIEGDTELELSFNHKYIKDTLSSIASDSVSLYFVDKNSPLVVKGESDDSYTYIVMPMTS